MLYSEDLFIRKYARSDMWGISAFWIIILLDALKYKRIITLDETKIFVSKVEEMNFIFIW